MGDNDLLVSVDQVKALVAGGLSVADELVDAPWWRVGGDELLRIGREVERWARTVFAVQVALAGEVEQQSLAKPRSCSSTGALLAQAFTISASEAFMRVNASRKVLTRESPSGAELGPLLPVLAAALAAGEVGPEPVRIIVTTMRRLPSRVDGPTRDWAENLLVEAAKVCGPVQLGKIAQKLEDTIDPDGTPDPQESAARMELCFGTRNAASGLTRLQGRFDDESMQILRTALDGLSAPRPSVDGVRDERPAARRTAQALIEALRRGLDVGVGPTQGGEKPHLTLVIDVATATAAGCTSPTSRAPGESGSSSNADTSCGGGSASRTTPSSAGTGTGIAGAVRSAVFDDGTTVGRLVLDKLLCDAQVRLAQMDGTEVLNLGRASRTFTVAMRRAITLRDRGCVWPFCDRPPSWCDAHHLAWWDRDDGETSYRNGILLCGFHHTQVHRAQWTARIGDDGTPEFIPPTWIDPKQTPRRNTTHHHPPTGYHT